MIDGNWKEFVGRRSSVDEEEDDGEEGAEDGRRSEVGRESTCEMKVS